MEKRVHISKEVVKKYLKKKGFLDAVKEAIKEAKPDLKFAGATVYLLGKEHILVLFLDEEENPISDMLIDIKKGEVITDPHMFKVKIEIPPQETMEHYKLWVDGKYYEGKAELLHPWLTPKEIFGT
ncbi:MAG: hypothetical protein GXO22_04160 [Aquificae bacterium]|nr:hypothetical protein [Aquificota bacterium]